MLPSPVLTFEEFFPSLLSSKYFISARNFLSSESVGKTDRENKNLHRNVIFELMKKNWDKNKIKIKIDQIGN